MYNVTILAPSNLSGTKIESIISNSAPQKILLPQQSQNAFIVIHGHNNFPKAMSKICEYLGSFNSDIYVPLLKYSGYTINDVNKFNNEDISKALYEDILYVIERGYKKVYCIAYSYSSLQVLYLSYLKKLPSNVEIILINPIVQAEFDNYLNRAIMYSSFIFSSYFLNPFKVSNYFMNHQYIYSKYAMLEILKMSGLISKLLNSDKDSIKNKLSVIFCKNDKVSSHNKSKPLIENQNQLEHFLTLEEGGHSIIFSEKEFHYLAEALDKCLKTS